MTETTADAAESDDALMRRFCSGDEAAFGLLYDRFAPDLGIFLRRFVQDTTLAEDLLQTTFLSFGLGQGIIIVNLYFFLSSPKSGQVHAVTQNSNIIQTRRN